MINLEDTPILAKTSLWNFDSVDNFPSIQTNLTLGSFLARASEMIEHDLNSNIYLKICT